MLQKLGFKTQIKAVPQQTMYSKFCGNTKAEYNVCPTAGWIEDFPDPYAYLYVPFSGKAIVPVNNVNWAVLNDPKINCQDKRQDYQVAGRRLFLDDKNQIRPLPRDAEYIGIMHTDIGLLKSPHGLRKQLLDLAPMLLIALRRLFPFCVGAVGDAVVRGLEPGKQLGSKVLHGCLRAFLCSVS